MRGVETGSENKTVPHSECVECSLCSGEFRKDRVQGWDEKKFHDYVEQ